MLGENEGAHFCSLGVGGRAGRQMRHVKRVGWGLHVRQGVSGQAIKGGWGLQVREGGVGRP